MARPNKHTASRKSRPTSSRQETTAQKTPTPPPEEKAAIPNSARRQTSPFTISNAAGRRDRKPSPIATGSRILNDGTILELVRLPQPQGEERLLHWANGESSTGREFAAKGSHYTPTEGASLIPHLPATVSPYGSTVALFDEVSDFIAKYTGLAKNDVTLLTFVCFSSFFFDCLSMAASLLVFGPPIQAMSLLRVLSCVCRHAIVSSGSGVRGIPPELRATRLICQADAGVEKELAALQFRGVNSLSADRREISSTTVIYAGEADLKTPFADLCFAFSVAPDGPSFSAQDEEQEIPTISRIQNQLLMYRIQNHLAVKSSRFDVPEFAGFTREFARTLGASIVDAPDLHARLIELLRPHDQADRTRNAVTLEAIILEALLVLCHERKPSVHVGKIAALANDILKEREEAVKITPKQTGARLRQIGIKTGRLDAGGRGIYLLNEQCARIHKLGRAFGVASLREGLPGCRYCQNDAHSARCARF